MNDDQGTFAAPPDPDVTRETAAIDLRDAERAAGTSELDLQAAELLAGGTDGKPDSHETAVQAHQLAKVLAGRGRVDDAVALYRRAVDIKQRVLGEGHPDVATTLHNLALLLEADGRTEEARSLWAQARAVLAPASQTDGAS